MTACWPTGFYERRAADRDAEAFSRLADRTRARGVGVSRKLCPPPPRDQLGSVSMNPPKRMTI